MPDQPTITLHHNGHPSPAWPESAAENDRLRERCDRLAGRNDRLSDVMIYAALLFLSIAASSASWLFGAPAWLAVGVPLLCSLAGLVGMLRAAGKGGVR